MTLKLPALFQLADEYLQAANQLSDMDLPEEVVADTLESMLGDLQVKATNVAMMARNLEAQAEAIKAAESVMAARRKAVERRAESLRSYLLANLQRAGISRVDSPMLSLAVKANPPKVVIDAAGLIPEEYMRQPPIPPPEPDKKAIAEDIKHGIDVPGCHLERSERLDIK